MPAMAAAATLAALRAPAALSGVGLSVGPDVVVEAGLKVVVAPVGETVVELCEPVWRARWRVRVWVRVRVLVLVVVVSPSATAIRGRRRAVKSAESCIVKMFECLVFVCRCL
ncbi:hypothetical protein B0T21DRAFT_30254 [Apiosordaria backusii]|uniref:Secreted protein n=1 Tax=Apiosordaria backusii TaxID=314023 RepID=A0AA40E330_9PEZI|nr:hypothetical protein B0T21DRAFT_30254 [Apiosordaria backusii]